jgi:hypothetical protein
MTLDSDIVIVSGLPRSGTSLMMQMLDTAGIPALTDQRRAADTDNPRGYYEFELVKKVRHDRSWLPDARGKVVKMISQLLYDLPADYRYRVIFMQRELDEVLESQEKMLKRLNQPTAPREQIRVAFEIHLQRLHTWLPQQSCMRVLLVNYNQLLERPVEQLARVAEFLDGRPDVAQMQSAIDPSLYRNRQAETGTAHA